MFYHHVFRLQSVKVEMDGVLALRDHLKGVAAHQYLEVNLDTLDL
jgi:hypothetical protein